MMRRPLASVPPAAIVLVALLIVLALAVPRFATVGNLANVTRIAAILALAAFGQSIAIVTGGLDFSSGSAVALTSVVTVLLLQSFGTTAAFAAGVAAAVAIGAFNGLLIAYCEMPAFLVTLGTLIAGHGLASVLVGGIPLEAPPAPGFFWLAQGTLARVPVPIVLAALGFAALAWLQRRTALGRAWYLIGANPRAARLAGVAIRRSIFAAYVLNGVFVAVAGLVLTARVSSGQPNLFPSLPFEAIAACAIGGLPLSGGLGKPVQVLTGVLIVTIVGNAVVLMNFSSAVQLMLIGALTVLAVLLQFGAPRWRAASRVAIRAGEGAR